MLKGKFKITNGGVLASPFCFAKHKEKSITKQHTQKNEREN